MSKFYLTVDSFILVLPSAISDELVVNWSLGPIGGSQQSKKSVEVASFEKDFLSLFDIWDYFSKSA